MWIVTPLVAMSRTAKLAGNVNVCAQEELGTTNPANHNTTPPTKARIRSSENCLRAIRASAVSAHRRAPASRLRTQSDSTSGLKSGMPQLQHLVSFARTAEQGSFSAAARTLGLTPAG